MPQVARLGDVSSHKGHIITASSNVHANGISVAREGDLHACPIAGHGTTPIKAVTHVARVNGRLVLTIGAVAGCGAVILGASPDVSAS